MQTINYESLDLVLYANHQVIFREWNIYVIYYTHGKHSRKGGPKHAAVSRKKIQRIIQKNINTDVRYSPIFDLVFAMGLSNAQHIARDVVCRHMWEYSTGIVILRYMAEHLIVRPLARQRIRSSCSIGGVRAIVKRRPLSVSQEEGNLGSGVRDACA